MGVIAVVVVNAAIDTAAIVAADILPQVSVCQTHDAIIAIVIDVAAADRRLPSRCLPRTSMVDSRS